MYNQAQRINMKQFANKFFSLFALTLVSAAGITLAYAPITQAACNDKLLTFPAWYRGLTDGDCNVSIEAVGAGKSDEEGGKLAVFIQILAINIIEIMLNAVAYVCIAFIIVGGFKYITSAGSPDGNEKGRKTITNALIGLVLSIVSIGIINLIAQGNSLF